MIHPSQPGICEHRGTAAQVAKIRLDQKINPDNSYGSVSVAVLFDRQSVNHFKRYIN
jgi:hypothetical protein